MLRETAKVTILTGAGFTNNFGGFLASEMWSRIFNQPNIQSTPRIRSLLINDSDFESVYAKIVNGDFTQDEKDVIEQAILTSYARLDNQVKDWAFNSGNPLAFNTYSNSGLGCLLGSLNTEPGRPGMWFTLNQDLLVERKWHHRSPGAPIFKSQLYDVHGASFDKSDFISLSEDLNLKDHVFEIIRSTTGVVYIKLHGSYGWKSPDGTNQIVLGHNKIDDIEKEPLLKIYSEIFSETLSQGSKRMVIIGYGFGDEHINKIIENNIDNSGLSVYVLGSSTFADFQKKISDRCPKILDGLMGYCDTPFQKLFPSSQGSKTTELEEILQAIRI